MTTEQPRRKLPLALPADRACTTATLLGGCFLLAAVFAAGCGSSGLASADASGDASCPSGSAPKAPPTTDAGATSQEAIEAQWFSRLDQAFGQYLRGDVLVYRGTVQGTAMGATPPGYDTVPTATIAEGPALARLAFAPGVESDWVIGSSAHAPFVDGNQAMLTVHSLAAEQYMVFEQPESDPSVTATSGIATVLTTNLLTPTCSGCAPNFWTRPTAIAFDLSAAGTVTTVTAGADATTSVDQPVTTTASVQLAVVPPCTLTFDNFETLNAATGPSEFSAVGLASFVLNGGEWIRHTGSSVETKPPSAHGQCDGQSFSYTIDLYVNAASLGDYGVRNYVQGPTRAVCAI